MTNLERIKVQARQEEVAAMANLEKLKTQTRQEEARMAQQIEDGGKRRRRASCWRGTACIWRANPEVGKSKKGNYSSGSVEISAGRSELSPTPIELQTCICSLDCCPQCCSYDESSAPSWTSNANLGTLFLYSNAEPEATRQCRFEPDYFSGRTTTSSGEPCGNNHRLQWQQE